MDSEEKTEEKRPPWRPLKFPSVDVLQSAIDGYFKDCDKRTRKVLLKDGSIADVPDPRPYTISGLAHFLDTTRDTLIDYQKRDPFSDAVTRAKTKIQAFAEESLWTPGISNGVVMSLTNSFGWRHKHEVDSTIKGKMSVRTDTSQLSDAEIDARIQSMLGTTSVVASAEINKAGIAVVKKRIYSKKQGRKAPTARPVKRARTAKVR